MTDAELRRMAEAARDLGAWARGLNPTVPDAEFATPYIRVDITDLLALLDRIDALTAELDCLGYVRADLAEAEKCINGPLDRIDAVRALHRPEMGWSPPECQICGDGPWPCATVRALDGEA